MVDEKGAAELTCPIISEDTFVAYIERIYLSDGKDFDPENFSIDEGDVGDVLIRWSFANSSWIMFNHNRLALARKRRRLTAKRLAECARVSAVTITRLEKGENQPDDSTVLRLSDALNYPVGFFFGDDPEPINIDAVSFLKYDEDDS